MKLALSPEPSSSFSNQPQYSLAQPHSKKCRINDMSAVGNCPTTLVLINSTLQMSKHEFIKIYDVPLLFIMVIASYTSPFSYHVPFLSESKTLDKVQHTSVMEGQGKRSRSPNWDAQMDRILVDLMLKEKHRNNYAAANFNTHSWTLLSSAFNSALGYSLTRDQLKDHWKLLKTKFMLYEELLKLSGWGWDPDNNIPIPDYDGAWEEVIKVNHKYLQICRRPFPLYNDMQLLCKKSIATGDLAEGISRGPTRPQNNVSATPNIDESVNEYYNVIPTAPNVEEQQFQADFSLGDNEDLMHMSVGQQSEPNASHYTPTSMNNTPTSLANMGSSSSKRKSTSIGNKGRGKKKAQSSLDNLVDVIRERNALLIRWRQQSESSSQQTPDLEVVPSIVECIKDLQEIPSLPYNVYLKAMNLFIEPKFRSLFSVMPDKDKVEWLKMMTADKP